MEDECLTKREPAPDSLTHPLYPTYALATPHLQKQNLYNSLITIHNYLGEKTNRLRRYQKGKKKKKIF